MNAVKKRDLLKTNAKKTFKAWQLYVLLIPALLWAIIFAYYPMYGVVIAFKDFIAALTAISPDYYEAATIDGASRFQRILYIDIPMILPTIILMLILQIGNIMNVGYEKAYLMQNGSNTIVSELISTYVYKVGLQTAQYSFATAVGLFNSVVNFIILVTANFIAKKVSDISIF